MQIYENGSNHINQSENMEGESNPGGTTSKKAKKVTYEKQLEEILKELQPKSGSGKGAKKQKLKPEQEIVLLEQKCILLLRLKRHKELVDDGYSIIGRMGPNVTVYKCILIALVRLGKTDDDFVELLEAWKKATPKCTEMLETKGKFDRYIAALRSGMKHSDIFSGIEDALSLNADGILSKQAADATVSEGKKWRFRDPPAPHTTFSLCPRSTSTNSCIYGNECVFAHSLEELKEWKMRVDGDKKNNNNYHPQEEVSLENAGQARKKFSVPPIYRTLMIPPLCIHYLMDLGKKIKDTPDIRKILADEIPGVRLRVDGPLNLQKTLDSSNKVQCKWTFSITSKMPLATVSILHDANRECFRFSTGMYFNKQKESIELIQLHTNNSMQTKLQVLNTFIQPTIFLRFNNGWPDQCYYKVEVTFESRDPLETADQSDRQITGLYRQSIVFDFKKDPKVVKHISVEVLPKLEPIGSHLSETSSASVTSSSVGVSQRAWGVINPSPCAEPSEIFTSPRPTGEGSGLKIYQHQGFNGESNERLIQQPSTSEFSSKYSDFPSLTHYTNTNGKGDASFSRAPGVGVRLKDTDVVDSDTGKVVRFKGFSLMALEECRLDGNLFAENVPLTKENYRTWMRDFLDVELIARQQAVNKLKKPMKVKISGNCLTFPEYKFKLPFPPNFYGEIELMSDISCDLKLERLIGGSCEFAIVSLPPETPSPFSLRKSSRPYLCRIVCKSKSAISIAIGGKAREDLQLLRDSIEDLVVQFVLDADYLENMKLMLECLSSFHLELLFPDFESCKLPFLKVTDPIGLVNEEELLLNNRQLNVYNLVTGRKMLIDSDGFTPPVLVTGGVSTGKSYLLAQCIRGIIRATSSSTSTMQSCRILVCTRSDLAADTYIIDYLHQWLINDELSVQRSKPLRVYDKNRFVDSVNGAVKHYCLFDDDGFRYPGAEEVLAHKIVISTFSTCSELIRLRLPEDTFSHIIIDEATDCLEVECVMPIILSGKTSKIVLSGDVVQARTNTFSLANGDPPISLLERVRRMYPFRHPFVVNLIDNYVNHEVIAKFIGKEFYHAQLRPALIQANHPTYYPLNFHHIPTSREVQAGNGGGSYNLDEIRHVVEFTEELIRTWPDCWEKWESAESKHNLVILTPYTNHINALRVHLQYKGLDTVNVELASSLQGKKYRVVVISTVRTYKESLSAPEDKATDGGFFSDKRLLCSALSAAKSLVVAFGDAQSLWNNGDCKNVWRNYITECQLNNSLKDVLAQAARHDSGTGSNSTPTNSARGNINNSGGATTPAQSLLYSPSLSGSGSSTPRQVSFPAMQPSFISPTVKPLPTQSQQNTVLPSAMSLDSSWGLKSALSEAPKTDMFSAFSTDAETLYGSNSPPVLSREKEDNPSSNILKDTLTKPATTSVSGLSLSDAIVSFTSQGIKSLDSQGGQRPIAPPVLAPGPRSNAPRANVPQRYTYKGSLQGPSLGMVKDLGNLKVSPGLGLTNVERKISREDDLNIIQSQPMPLPVPTIPSRVLFDQKYLIDDRVKPQNPPRSHFVELGNPSSPKIPMQSFLCSPPPPGFTPIPSDCSSNFGTFSPLDDHFGFPESPPKTPIGAGVNGGISSKNSFKNKSTYELPPRMRNKSNYQLATTTTTSRSPVLKKLQPQPPAEMNFFQELGLDSQPQSSSAPTLDHSRSASSASSDHSFLEIEDHSLVDEEEDSPVNTTVPVDDWIEVKSSRRGKGQGANAKKTRGKAKAVDSTLDDDFFGRSSELTQEMWMVDKVGVITGMGFPKALAIQALIECDKDLQRAVDWLISKQTKSST